MVDVISSVFAQQNEGAHRPPSPFGPPASSKEGLSNFELWLIRYVKTMLVGGIPIPLKNMKVNWDLYSQDLEK